LSVFILVLIYRLCTVFTVWSGNPLFFIMFHSLPWDTHETPSCSL
jgi:hypothetical protein